MARDSAFRGSWEPNRRPYISLTADAYVALQGETTVIACGECRREVDINQFVTGISTEASVDSPPGSATVNMSIPDNRINEFYVEGEFIIIPMMEVEIYGKGYFTIGGFPQYYRMFWGLISSVNQTWSNGVTNITINCKDILRWWELTTVVTNPAFLDIGKSSSGFNLFGNKFAGNNPYAVIIALAKEAMGDFPISDGSFLSFVPDGGPEKGVLSSYAKNIMAYWQLKFGNIWNRLTLYGSSGQAYSFTGVSRTINPVQIANKIFQEEAQALNLNEATAQFKIQPHEIAAFKVELSRAGDIDLFQNESQSKLSIALTARDQAGSYEFYCDTTGDIVFKPPFYNLNVIPNKPISWIQDYEVIDDGLNNSEGEVYTHLTSSGNAFGGVMDWGLNDEITTPRTGVIDYHLLRQYGHRRLNLQVEWAGNARKLFYFLLDHLDKVNAKRINGTVTIPMRPELRMGFPIWFPKHEAFFYVQGISHNFSPGGQATTTLTLIAKRSKFIAPKNIGTLKKHVNTTGPSKPPSQNVTGQNNKNQTTQTNSEIATTYDISFPTAVGATSGTQASQDKDSGTRFDEPAVLRDVRTGKILGYPNVVMAYRTTLDDVVLAKLLTEMGSVKGKKPGPGDKTAKTDDNKGNYSRTSDGVFQMLAEESRANVIDQLRLHRYETGMSNAGVYDYAHDVEGVVKEFSVIPMDSVTWTPAVNRRGKGSPDQIKAIATATNKKIAALQQQLTAAQKSLATASKIAKDNQKAKDGLPQGQSAGAPEAQFRASSVAVDEATVQVSSLTKQIQELRLYLRDNRGLPNLNMMLRPVSDEFGFEVIGHYRYGRGVFVDRGKIQIQANSDGSNQKNPAVANKLNTQFAAAGGILTDGFSQNVLGPESTTFSQAFEEMTPEDYRTGASFTGKQYDANQRLEGIQLTGIQTYTNAINSSRDQAGKGAIFAEADALRRAVTLAELKPTLPSHFVIDGKAAFSKCSCGIGRYMWLAVLPQDFVRKVLESPTALLADEDANVNTLAEGSDSTYSIPPKGESKGLPGNGGTIRERAAQLAISMRGLNNSADSIDAYLNALFAPDDRIARGDTALHLQSSCGMAALGYLRQMGLVDEDTIRYNPGKGAADNFLNLGRKYNALGYDRDNPGSSSNPPAQIGDVISMAGGPRRPDGSAWQHVLIVTDVQQNSDGSFCTWATEGGNEVYVPNSGASTQQGAFGYISDFVNKNVHKKDPNLHMGIAANSVQRCWTRNSATGAWSSNGRNMIASIDLEKILANQQAATAASIQAAINANSKASASASGTQSGMQGQYDTADSLQVAQGNHFSLAASGFFDLLHDYLVQRFNQLYSSGNMPRENYATYGNRQISAESSFEQDNIQPTPSNTLFDRAAQGDPDALNALTQGANFNFGQTAAAASNFKDQFQAGGAVDQAWKNTQDMAGQAYDPKTGDLTNWGSVASISTSGPQGTTDTVLAGPVQPPSTPDSNAPTEPDYQGNKLATIARTVKNKQLPKSLQSGQWQPPAQLSLPTKINTTKAAFVVPGPVLVKG